MTEPDQSPLVSIIIPTRNSGQTIGPCLSSLRQQSYSNIELIIVDNQSSDNTLQIGEAFAARIYTHGPERGAQKNFGAMQSAGQAIFFIDSDMELSSSVVAECVRALVHYDAIMIPEISVGTGFWNACVALERSCYVGDDHTEAARFYRRAVFEQLAGFDESLVASGDDMDLSQRARRRGYRLGRIEAAILHREGARSPKMTFLKWRYYGRNMGRYINKNRREAFMQYLPVRPAWIRHWRRLLRAPLRTAGFMFLKLCQLGGVALGQIEALIRPDNPLRSDPYDAGQSNSNVADH
jgi:glycosyltransferase involved in cell wall biosynthesis